MMKALLRLRVYAIYIKIMSNQYKTVHEFENSLQANSMKQNCIARIKNSTLYIFHHKKDNTMNHLNTYGWNDKLNQLKQESPYKSLSHGRVTIVHRTCYEVITEDGLFQCELTGNMMFGKSDFELPCTGDWVIFQPFDDNKGIIVDMLPRERTLYRKKSGTVADKQAIASYVDKAFIVQSLDDNFNIRRVERFMVQILEENIKPVLVLNKADLGFDNQKIEDAIKHVARQIPVFLTSIHNPETIHQLRESIAEGETVVFVGSSGVGKSSLINVLCEEPVLLTSGISLSTGKGRHTSTRREMVLMKGSGVLIDTPGVREFGLAVDNPDSLAEMLEISDYAESCRFANCTHVNEPGCKVLEAINNGVLDPKVYESYLKLRREAWHFSTSEHEKRKRDKSFSKLIDEVKKRKANS
jgi:ribosome biogenesis GTPase